MTAGAVRVLCIASLGISALVVSGCSDVVWDDGLGLTITFSDTVVCADRPVVVTLTAMNLGDSVVWGTGSSSCQLDAVVAIGITQHSIATLRGCTDDVVTQGLASGEALAEQWPWSGQAVNNGVTEDLAAGTYQITVLAGDVGRSAPRSIRICQPQGQ